jgi:hypothetical protein
MKNVIFLLIGIFCLFTSCKTTYVSKQFNYNEITEAPDYSNPDHWAVLPTKIPEQLKRFIKPKVKLEADVFFVYPTLFTDKKNDAWNASISDTVFNNEILNQSIHFQASAWASSGKLYVPYYRQSHYRIYVEPYKKQSGDSYEVAYGDVKKAFEYYLENFNNNRPIILASHSQGSSHSKRLLKEFFDDKPLQKQLVAAYIIGTKVLANEFKTLKPMKESDEVGGYVSWNSYKRKRMPKNYNTWFKGGVTSNPITWDAQKSSKITDHKGVLYSDNFIYKQSLAVEVKDGLLWVSVPKVPKRFFLRFIKNYHFADINLFWQDINLNAQERVKTYLENNAIK